MLFEILSGIVLIGVLTAVLTAAGTIVMNKFM